MCKTFPPNKREVCLVARASIKVVSENRLPSIVQGGEKQRMGVMIAPCSAGQQRVTR